MVGLKTNVIPDKVVIEVDIRTLPGETGEDVNAHLRAALGDLMDAVDVDILQEDASSASPTDNRFVGCPGRFDEGGLPRGQGDPQPRHRRAPMPVSSGAGGPWPTGPDCSAPRSTPVSSSSRFHGHDERIDIESLRLTVGLWLDVVDRLWGLSRA